MLLAMFVEISLRTLRIRLDGVRIRLRVPISRTDFTVLLHELEGLDESQRFVHGSAHRQVIDRDLSNYTVRINDEQAAERNSGILQQNTIIGRDFLS